MKGAGCGAHFLDQKMMRVRGGLSDDKYFVRRRILFLFLGFVRLVLLFLSSWVIKHCFHRKEFRRKNVGNV